MIKQLHLPFSQPNYDYEPLPEDTKHRIKRLEVDYNKYEILVFKLYFMGCIVDTLGDPMGTDGCRHNMNDAPSTGALEEP